MSPFLSINLLDIGKGALVAFLAGFMSVVYPVFQSGTLPTGANLSTGLTVALSAGLAYVAKNFFTNSQNKLLKGEVKSDAPKAP